MFFNHVVSTLEKQPAACGWGGNPSSVFPCPVDFATIPTGASHDQLGKLAQLNFALFENVLRE